VSSPVRSEFTFTIQWQTPSNDRPWLQAVAVVGLDGAEVRRTPLAIAADRKPGAEKRTGAPDAFAQGASITLCSNDPALENLKAQIDLGGGVGFTLSQRLLEQEPYVWLKDLGVFACAKGDFHSWRKDMEERRKRIEAAANTAFVSTGEEYAAYTGKSPLHSSQDVEAFAFAYDAARPLCPRAADAIRQMPEVDYDYFVARVPEQPFRRMFLGWPYAVQKFYVLSNGAIGVGSNVTCGTGHPIPEHFLVDMMVGPHPYFREHGDPASRQYLEDDYHLIVNTKGGGPGAKPEECHATAFAYPLDSPDVHTGYEPIAAFVRIRRPAGSASPIWLRVRPTQWVGPYNPLPGLEAAVCNRGRLTLGERTVLAFANGETKDIKANPGEILLALVPSGDHVDVVIPYIQVDSELLTKALERGYDAALDATKQYWDECLAGGAAVATPDPMVNHLYKTFYPRTMVCADLDTEGDYVLKTSPHWYEAVWLHITACGIEGLARRGHFAEAQRFLDAAFRWQGSQPSDSQHFTDWEGFFNAPPRYTAALWLNFHGWMQWAAARYVMFSNDRAWLEAHLPQLIKSLEWTSSQRRLTMHENPDGSRPANYGWLPSGRVSDASSGTSTFTDCIAWMGYNEMTALLERIGHRNAEAFRAEADSYRHDILVGLAAATRSREPVRLNDGTYVPYVPGYLETEGHEEDVWYAGVVDGALEGIMDSGICAPARADKPASKGRDAERVAAEIETWALRNLEDNLFVIAPNLCDEAYFLGHAMAYLRRDDPELFIYTFYSVLANHMSRHTFTTFEHRSSGMSAIWELAPWAMGYYTRALAGTLCYDEGDGLILCRAAPRRWLDPGNTIAFERLMTRFGAVSLSLSAEERRISGTIQLKRHHDPAEMKLRVRVNGTILKAAINGRETPFDPTDETLELMLTDDSQTVRIDLER